MSGADPRAASRYASALFAASQKTGQTDVVGEDLAALAGIWRSTPAMSALLTSPTVSSERKHSLVDTVFGDACHLTRSLLHLLIAKRREAVLPQLQLDFGRLADEAKGVVRAEASVAFPISDQETAMLAAALSLRTGKSVELKVRVDPSVIGGVTVRLQDTVLDGSVRGALERARESLLR